MSTGAQSGSAVLHPPVLIVGAGPVGSVLALELAGHGIHSLLLERSLAPSRFPKIDFVNGRSMELLHRLGLAEGIRRHAVGDTHPFNVVWTRDFAEPPIAEWHFGSVAEVSDLIAAVNDGSMPAEPYRRMLGSGLEEVLRDAVRGCDLVDLREGWTVTDVSPRPDGVTVSAFDATTATRHTVRAQYLAACDGAASTVRQCLEIPMKRSGPPSSRCSVYFRSRDPALRRHGRAFVTIAAGGAVLVSRDELDTWTGGFGVPGDEPLTADPVALLQDRLGLEFAVDKVLDVTQSQAVLAVARSYRSGPVFLVGDAAHQFSPAGGYGASTGFADAVDLGWKLAARLVGWGGADLLDSYEAERRPVAVFNGEMCRNLLEICRRFGRLVADGASREQLAGYLAEETHQQDNIGVHFGYRYSRSPVIRYDRGPAPAWQWRRITPTTWPGGRAPALRLADGSALFDHFGPELTLVDLSVGNVGLGMAEEANRRGIPMLHLVVADPAVRASWERDLVLVRPDQHVAWRGNRVPADWPAVLDQVSGRQARWRRVPARSAPSARR